MHQHRTLCCFQYGNWKLGNVLNENHYYTTSLYFQELWLIPVSHPELPPLPVGISFPFHHFISPELCCAPFSSPLPGLSQSLATTWRSSNPPCWASSPESPQLALGEGTGLWAVGKSEYALEAGNGKKLFLLPCSLLREHKFGDTLTLAQWYLLFQFLTSKTIKYHIHIVWSH